MRVLVLTKYAWDDKIASGNTLTNLFSCWPDTIFYAIYCRDAPPNNSCCRDYFKVSPINILKNVFTPWKIGANYSSNDLIKDEDNSTVKEQMLTKMSKSSRLFTLIYDILYSSRIWFNNNIKSFIRKADPDIVFSFGVPDAFNYVILDYFKKRNTPIVTYYVDDHFIRNLGVLDFYGKVFRNRILKIAHISDKRYAISQLMCDEYSKMMGVKFDLLTKGCKVEDVIIKHNSPLRIVYAGNLLYNRDKTLIELISSIKNINSRKEDVFLLDIYTGSILNEETKSLFNVPGVSAVHPPKQYCEIIKTLKEADIVLFVESFDKEQEKVVRMSFSTKITDCMQSGSMVLAIGPSTLASISFLVNVPGVITVTNPKELGNTLEMIYHDPSLLKKYAKATNEYARKEMSAEKIRLRLQAGFHSLIQQKQNK